MATVMIVDDSGYSRRTHRRIVESAGHTVHEAATGLAALEGVFVHQPDVVLLDLTMEDMSGFEVLERLREIRPETRVIVVSADVQRSTVEMVAASGAIRFLGKPVAADALLDAVRDAVEQAP